MGSVLSQDEINKLMNKLTKNYWYYGKIDN